MQENTKEEVQTRLKPDREVITEDIIVFATQNRGIAQVMS